MPILADKIESLENGIAPQVIKAKIPMTIEVMANAVAS